MTPDDSYEVPFDEATADRATSVDAESEMGDDIDQPISKSLTDERGGDVLDVQVDSDPEQAADFEVDPEVEKARRAFETDDDAYEDVSDSNGSDSLSGVNDSDHVQNVDDDEQLATLATPFVGRWNALISTTNWAKGRIISDWRGALIATGVGSDQYSDEAWARRVGGVTAPHVGRLRRVFDHFGSSFESYEGLYWSHFLAALDWEDAALWLEGAVQSGWSVSKMREQRWQAHGAVDSQRPTASQIVEVDTDEDVDRSIVEAAQNQDAKGTREYGDEPGTAMGKTYEDADFGDEEELQSLAGNNELPHPGGLGVAPENAEPMPSAVQPFAGLPELPDDLTDAIEMMKLAILRHKSDKWAKIDIDIVAKYLEAVGVLLRSP